MSGVGYLELHNGKVWYRREGAGGAATVFGQLFGQYKTVIG